MGNRRVGPCECSGASQREQRADLRQAKTFGKNCGERARHQHHCDDPPRRRLTLQMSGKPDSAGECQRGDGEWCGWAWLQGSHLVWPVRMQSTPICGQYVWQLSCQPDHAFNVEGLREQVE